jgi:hypothetical protein
MGTKAAGVSVVVVVVAGKELTRPPHAHGRMRFPLGPVSGLALWLASPMIVILDVLASVAWQELRHKAILASLLLRPGLSRPRSPSLAPRPPPAALPPAVCSAKDTPFMCGREYRRAVPYLHLVGPPGVLSSATRGHAPEPLRDFSQSRLSRSRGIPRGPSLPVPPIAEVHERSP